MSEQPMRKGLLVSGCSPHLVGDRHRECSSRSQRRHRRLGQGSRWPGSDTGSAVVAGENADVRLPRPPYIRQHHWAAVSPESSKLEQCGPQSEVDKPATSRKLATGRENARVFDRRLADLEVQHVDRAPCDPAEAP